MIPLKELPKAYFVFSLLFLIVAKDHNEQKSTSSLSFAKYATRDLSNCFKKKGVRVRVCAIRYPNIYACEWRHYALPISVLRTSFMCSRLRRSQSWYVYISIGVSVNGVTENTRTTQGNHSHALFISNSAERLLPMPDFF